ncbi:histidine triad nucleotide-binding protein 3 [Trichonephila clavata]|uniref:Adenosine 5'-monophosphoramidase HINT3 n=1 Tax=Trichonephila clavata TaxID=2740835 RepID=A0A8X6J1R4_TRICU|nr:histidine triad nucleotide-binding protein 3 [Trichonephila clavata]
MQADLWLVPDELGKACDIFFISKNRSLHESRNHNNVKSRKEIGIKMAEAKKEENCLFCGIQDSSTEIVYQDDDYLAFRDIKPATSHHYLVIPKNHIRSVVNLTPSDIGLVRKLVEIGEIVLNNNSASVSDAR